MNDFNEIPSSQTLTDLKEEMFNDILSRLGGNMVDVEIDANDFNTAWRYALKMYRQRTQHSTQEGYIQMMLIKNTWEYTLPQEIVNVRNVYRRTVGLETGVGAQSFDPFSSAVLNSYLIGGQGVGGLATYDLWQGFIKLTARMFGGYVTYTFNPVTKVLRLDRDFKSTGERILIQADMTRPEIELIQDPGSGVWLYDFTLAVLKETLGQAREKFGSIPGPGGGTTLNGSALKAEAKADQERLLQDLRNYQDWSTPLSWIQG